MDDGAITDKPSSSSTPGASSGVSAPKLLNAFDVVNMFGGIELGRLMETGEKRTNGSTANPQLLSAAPAETLIQRVTDSMKGLGAAVTQEESKFKVKGRVLTGKGEITLTAVVYRMSEQPPLHLLEITRGRGEPLEFAALQAKLKAQLADLAVKSR